MSHPNKAKLVVEMADGRIRTYPCAPAAAEKRLADHEAMVAAFGTAALYKRAYIEKEGTA